MTTLSTLTFGVLSIVWINLLLSADNAILIALASRNLPERQKRLCMILGATGAVVLRVVFTLIVAQLLRVPFLKLGGGLFVVYLAAKLPNQGDNQVHVRAKPTLLAAVWSIAAADVVMSLDNALALAAAANGSIALIVLGLLISAPLVVFGARLLSGLMDRVPLLIWAGAALLGWAAGEMIADDPAWDRLELASPSALWTAMAATGLVLAMAAWTRHGAPWRPFARQGGD